MLYKYVGCITGQYIPEDAAAHAGHNADENSEEIPCVRNYFKAALNAHGGKNSQTQRVHPEHAQPIEIVVVGGETPYGGDKQDDGHSKGTEGVNRVLKGLGRSAAQQNIPDDAAAYSHAESQHADTKNVHLLFYSQHGTGGRKGHCTQKLKYQSNIKLHK